MQASAHLFDQGKCDRLYFTRQGACFHNQVVHVLSYLGIAFATLEDRGHDFEPEQLI